MKVRLLCLQVVIFVLTMNMMKMIWRGLCRVVIRSVRITGPGTSIKWFVTRCRVVPPQKALWKCFHTRDGRGRTTFFFQKNLQVNSVSDFGRLAEMYAICGVNGTTEQLQICSYKRSMVSFSVYLMREVIMYV